MGEAFVDLFYRGLPLGSRARMTHIEARSAYVELPAPMPIGTAISISADGLTIPARVLEIYEQTAGSERPPGMRIRAALDSEAEQKWWASVGGDAQAAADATPEATVAKAEEKVDATPAAADEPASTSASTSAADHVLEQPVLPEAAAKPARAVATSSASHDTQVMEAMPEHLAAAIEAEAPATPPTAKAAQDVNEAAAEESTDVHPVVNADGDSGSDAPNAEVTDEPSGVVDSPDSPEPPNAGDAAPKGRNKRGRSKRR